MQRLAALHVPVLVSLGLAPLSCEFSGQGATGGPVTGEIPDTTTGTGGSDDGVNPTTVTTLRTGPSNDDEDDDATVGGDDDDDAEIATGDDDDDASTTTQGGDDDDDMDSSGGELPDGFVDEGLLVRYFLDEADSGTDEPEVADASMVDPLPLDISYSGGLPFFTEVDGNRGLMWDAPGEDGGPRVEILGTKIQDLDGLTEATIEVVVLLESVTEQASRLSHIGAGSGSDFTLSSSADDQVEFRLTGSTPGVWSVPFSDGNPVVLTLLFDSEEGEGSDRVLLFVDGEPVAASEYQAPPQGTTISLAPAGRYSIGNRGNGSRSIEGVLFYAAMYTVALDETQVAHNAEILLDDDDTP